MRVRSAPPVMVSRAPVRALTARPMERPKKPLPVVFSEVNECKAT